MGNSGRLLKKLKIELPYDGIPHLGIYLKEMKHLIQTDMCNPMFTVGLLKAYSGHGNNLIPLKDEWIKKTWKTYTADPRTLWKLEAPTHPSVENSYNLQQALDI